jgi:hypothetical protein
MQKIASLARQQANKGAGKARDKALDAAAKRKEEFLGARVPKSLKDKVSSRAEELGIPVSLLIRKVLEEVFDSSGEAPLASITEQLVSPVSSSQRTRYNDVLGWKELELNKQQACERCSSLMPAGAEAIMGVQPDNGLVIICSACKEQLKA